jgi:hypothetical protein
VFCRRTLWRLSVRRQPSAGAAWLARTKVSYSRIWLWLRCAALLYSTTDLPVGDRDRQDHDRQLWPPRPRLAPRDSCPSVGSQTGQFGRSEAEAKLHRSGLNPRTTLASCEAIRGPDHGSFGLALSARRGRLRRFATALVRSL